MALAAAIAKAKRIKERALKKCFKFMAYEQKRLYLSMPANDETRYIANALNSSGPLIQFKIPDNSASTTASPLSPAIHTLINNVFLKPDLDTATRDSITLILTTMLQEQGQTVLANDLAAFSRRAAEHKKKAATSEYTFRRALWAEFNHRAKEAAESEPTHERHEAFLELQQQGVAARELRHSWVGVETAARKFVARFGEALGIEEFEISQSLFETHIS